MKLEELTGKVIYHPEDDQILDVMNGNSFKECRAVVYDQYGEGDLMWGIYHKDKELNTDAFIILGDL